MKENNIYQHGGVKEKHDLCQLFNWKLNFFQVIRTVFSVFWVKYFLCDFSYFQKKYKDLSPLDSFIYIPWEILTFRII